ncbi:MAG: transcription termination/antitermination protein NusA [Erysipelotrichales bacterium]|nr:transcription termination/antitermination protein NusA [Erysipelotrichales bacterium]
MAARKKSEKPDFLKSLRSLIDDRNISEEIIIEALKDAMAKAYRKQKDIPDLLVRVEINPKGAMEIYQQRLIVEEVEDDELEISLKDAKAINPNLELGETVDELVDLSDEENQFDRASAVLAKNVLKQKIREAEKAIIYEEYIDKIEEMVNGIVQSVEEKYVIVNLGKTLAMMPKGAQIPGEHYREGQTINVIISEVNKETKGAQVLVSRADANLVKRLFEREVPEIYDGIVEIKAIAREAGERTKMAVYSHNDNIDAIGSCIGPKGGRVQAVMDELHGEKIDIFEWSEDAVQLIKNSLSPANVLGVINSPDNKGLTVVVPDNQLSLAIGKKGKNARLAVRLTNLKIDIKSESDMEEKGIDYRALAINSLLPKYAEVKEEVVEEITPVVEEVVETVEVIEEPVVEETVEVVETVVEKPAKATKEVKETKENVIKERGVKNTDYVSRFEAFAGGSTTTEEPKKPSRKKYNTNKEDDERRVHMNLKDIKYEVKPEYTEEELEEIRINEENNNNWYDDDIDYDEYDKYYEEDE